MPTADPTKGPINRRLYEIQLHCEEKHNAGPYRYRNRAKEWHDETFPGCGDLNFDRAGEDIGDVEVAAKDEESRKHPSNRSGISYRAGRYSRPTEADVQRSNAGPQFRTLMANLPSILRSSDDPHNIAVKADRMLVDLYEELGGDRERFVDALFLTEPEDLTPRSWIYRMVLSEIKGLEETGEGPEKAASAIESRIEWLFENADNPSDAVDLMFMAELIED